MTNEKLNKNHLKPKSKIQEKKRSSKIQSDLKKIKEENARIKEQLLRKAAEFDNYKKRTERELFHRVQNATEHLIIELLPVLDDLERSIANSEDLSSLREGIELIYKKLILLLEKEGLKSLVSVGTEFDPEKHDALMQIENEQIKSGIIIEEHQKGYILNDKVIRHAQVIVAK